MYTKKEEIASSGEANKPWDNFSVAAFPPIRMNVQLLWLLMSPGRKVWVCELGTYETLLSHNQKAGKERKPASVTQRSLHPRLQVITANPLWGITDARK